MIRTDVFLYPRLVDTEFHMLNGFVELHLGGQPGGRFGKERNAVFGEGRLKFVGIKA